MSSAHSFDVPAGTIDKAGLEMRVTAGRNYRRGDHAVLRSGSDRRVYVITQIYPEGTSRWLWLAAIPSKEAPA